MPASTYHFPFGQPVKDVKQKDRSPKHTFVLGVYASAVHATWKDADGKMLVRAMAVASEPEIFWNGKGAARIIKKIAVPEGAGTLEAAANMYNGPSAKALDDLILKPLGMTDRSNVWLCDCVPHSCGNSNQRDVLAMYNVRRKMFGLPEAKLPSLPRSISAQRREEILQELEESKATQLVLLGDKPMQWFLAPLVPGWTNLADFTDKHVYGSKVEVVINGKAYQVLPLAHPRQIAKLGLSSPKWAEAHQTWLDSLK